MEANNKYYVVEDKNNMETEIERICKEIEQEKKLEEEIKKQLKNYKLELENAKNEKEKNIKELNLIKHKYQAIENSTIWRFTLPIRKAGAILKRVFKNKSNPNNQKVKERKTREEDLNKIKEILSNKKKNTKSILFKETANDPVKLMRSAKPKNIEKLKTEYKQKGLDKQPDTFILYRIIGNDLYPRHKKGQSRENLQFILENEPELENCEKRWIVNRIIDKNEEKAIIGLLNKYNQEYIHIPFKSEEYKKIGWDTDCLPKPGYFASEEFETLKDQDKNRVLGAVYRLKNNYVMNNNGARNVALRDGKSKAKWVLPWDGNCFITTAAWKRICSDILASPYLKYFAVPMTRVLDNSQLLLDDFTPDPVEEPQLIFRCDAVEEFNEDFSYGRRPKVELFWRLGIPGKWDRWKDDPWDQKRRPLSQEARQFGVAGWVARMYSGVKSLEMDNQQSFKQRGRVRQQAIINTLNYVNTIVTETSVNTLTNFNKKVLDAEVKTYQTGEDTALTELINKLITDAEEALKRGPYSVIDKTTLPPSGNKNDYWHPAPYWWPNPKKKDGLPYIRRDGQRVPGTRMYEPESDKYDRTRLQRVFDDTTILALAWKFTGEMKYAEHGAKILERFFINPETAMTPHLKYGQVRMGHNNNMGASTGIIEMKDMYYYLDAIRLLNISGAIKENNLQIFKEWLSTYLEWLLESPQGKKERKEKNNHGTYYDLQVASIASFIGEKSVLYETLLRAQSRISQQFAKDGSQPEELTRTITAHYCCFNFQGWLNIIEIASRWGVDLWTYESSDGVSLRKGAQWLLSHMGKNWPYKQIEEFDTERFLPIWFIVSEKCIEAPVSDDIPSTKYAVKPKFYPHDGIRPYWNLGCISAYSSNT